MGVQQAEWRSFGACKGMVLEVFYPETEAAAAKAKRVCQRCPVIDLCLAYAMEVRENAGVWGGLTERERRRIWRSEKQLT